MGDYELWLKFWWIHHERDRAVVGQAQFLLGCHTQIYPWVERLLRYGQGIFCDSDKKNVSVKRWFIVVADSCSSLVVTFVSLKNIRIAKKFITKIKMQLFVKFEPSRCSIECFVCKIWLFGPKTERGMETSSWRGSSLKGELLFSSVEQVTIIHGHWLCLSSKVHHILAQ